MKSGWGSETYKRMTMDYECVKVSMFYKAIIAASGQEEAGISARSKCLEVVYKVATKNGV